MTHKHSLKVLNRTLKDIKSKDKIFGSTLLLLLDDFRQTLPVISRSTYADETNAWQQRWQQPFSLFVLAKDGLTKNIVHSIALRD